MALVRTHSGCIGNWLYLLFVKLGTGEHFGTTRTLFFLAEGGAPRVFSFQFLKIISIYSGNGPKSVIETVNRRESFLQMANRFRVQPQNKQIRKKISTCLMFHLDLYFRPLLVRLAGCYDPTCR